MCYQCVARAGVQHQHLDEYLSDVHNVQACSVRLYVRMCDAYSVSMYVPLHNRYMCGNVLLAHHMQFDLCVYIFAFVCVRAFAFTSVSIL